MKKLIITLMVAVVGFTAKAQEFNLGLSAATPVGEAGDLFSSTFILDAEYLHKMSEKIKLGATTGYLFSASNSDSDRVTLLDGNTIRSTSIPNTGFIPLAASFRFMATEKLTFGADGGYAFGVTPSNIKGGFYFALKAQYQVKDYLYLSTSYRSIILDDTRDPNIYDVGDDKLNLGFLSFGVLIKL